MRILIIEGSQSPPSFIGNLINGLLEHGVKIALLGKSHKTIFKPELKNQFTRLITDYSSLRRIRLLLDFIFLAITQPGAFKQAINSLGNNKGYKQRFLDIILYSKIYTYNPDIIHIQWVGHLATYAGIVRSGKYKCVVSLRGSQINVGPVVDTGIRLVYEDMFGLIDGFHAVSMQISKEAEKYGARNINVIYSIIPTHFFHYYERDQNPVRKPLSVLSVGRFHWIKGYTYGIEAIYRLRLKGVLATYTIVGVSEVPEEILFMIDQLDLQDQIRFINRLDYRQVPVLMKGNSVLMLPSLAEGIANVVLEAMAIGLPVICTDVGGMSEVIVHNQTGWLVPVADSEAMANALLNYLQTSEQALTDIRQNAHRWILKNHNENIQVAKFIDLYSKILNESNHVIRSGT